MLLGRGARRSDEHDVPQYPDLLKLRVRVWDGDQAVVPAVTLDFVRKEMLIYQPLGVRGGEHLGAAAAGGSSGVASVAALSTPTVLEMTTSRAQRYSSDASIEAEVRASRDFQKVLRKVWHSRSKDLLVLPSRRAVNVDTFAFFYQGRRIRRPRFPGHARLRIVDVMDHSRGSTLGWAQNTLDLALNPEAERFLKSQYYTFSTTFAVTIDAVELTPAASKDAKFGRNPATYVTVTHGEHVRASQVVSGTSSPTFQWTTGAIPYDKRKPLRVQLHVILSLDGQPQIGADPVIGNMYLPAPFLPPSRAMAAPEIMTASLGLGVGVVQISMRGPTLRHEQEQGLVIAPCGTDGPCICYVCCSPPCCPSVGVCAQHAYRSSSLCWQQTATTLGPTLCCCLQVGAVAALVAVAGRAVLK
ncbi:hypothetical protein KFE25_007431 [Diacronema lutheri]|uniref:C2 domain-containing protein n=2 Tax=Diacronema lutheri TaxID=2081491 RepID=A0A8J5XP72_DIALT|nr:hypothetical protein KFE25_007431 [Diacronema lutheri]